MGSRMSSARNKGQTPRSSVGQADKYVGEILSRVNFEDGKSVNYYVQY
jgi:hypothetical protein